MQTVSYCLVHRGGGSFGGPLKIALDATPLVLSSGGLQRYVAELSCALAREFPDDKYQLMSDQPFQTPPDCPPNLIQSRNETSRRWWLWGLRRALRDNGVQLFHGTNFEVPWLPPVPSVMTIHDLSPWRNPEWHPGPNRVRNRTPWLIRLHRASRILTVSEAVRREVIARFGVADELVRSVPLAASDRFRPLNVMEPRATPYFLYVGTLEPRKNIEALVDTWTATQAQTGAELILVGRTRSDFVPIPPRPGLIQVGEVPDEELPGLYSNALAFVYPTHYEGFGLPVLEAMQSGCPVITSRDPAVMEVSGGAALHAHGTAELAQAMIAVSETPELCQQLRTGGLRRAEDFSWRRTATETRALYSEALALSSAPGAAH